MLKVIQNRSELTNTKNALKKNKITIGFIGGSITDGRTNWNWPDPFCSWLVNTTGVRLTVENAAIGGTGSDLATMRVDREIINRNCDLVFVEYAVNDWWFSPDYREKTREGLIRKLLAYGKCDIVLVYTYGQYMYPFMIAGQIPPSIAEFEKIADYYKLNSVWMALNSFEQIKSGIMQFDEWLPDNLHPQYRGSLSYAEAVIAFFKANLYSKKVSGKSLSGKKMPEPINKFNWENLQILPFSKVVLSGNWIIKRWNKLAFIEQALWTTSIGAKLSFKFVGRGLILGFDHGSASSEFCYRIDNGEWKTSKRDRPDWCGAEGWYTPYFITDELTPESHKFELKVIHGNSVGDTSMNQKYISTRFVLGSIGVIP